MMVHLPALIVAKMLKVPKFTLQNVVSGEYCTDGKELTVA
jgi:hypothetical protein